MLCNLTLPEPMKVMAESEPCQLYTNIKARYIKLPYLLVAISHLHTFFPNEKEFICSNLTMRCAKNQQEKSLTLQKQISMIKQRQNMDNCAVHRLIEDG